MAMTREGMTCVGVAAASIAVGTATTIIGYYYFLQAQPWALALKVAAAGLIFALTAPCALELIVAVVRPCLCRLTSGQAISCILLGLFCGFGLVIVIPVMPPEGLMPEQWLQTACVYLSAALGMALVFTATCLWLVGRKAIGAANVPGGALARWTWLGYGLPLLITGGIYLHAFWPALMSLDSFEQWHQMTTGRYCDQHPIFHTLTNWLITRLWLSPSAVALVQLLTLAILAAWIIRRLRQWGMPRWLAWATCLVFGLTPATGVLAITLWKDIPYGITMLAVTLFVMETIQSGGAWLQKWVAAICLGVGLALVALYRHNGLPIAVGLPVLLLLAYRRQWRGTIAAAATAAILIAVVRGPLYRAVSDPARRSFGQHYAQVLIWNQYIAAHLAHDTPMRDEERSFLNDLYPTREGCWPYEPLGVGGNVLLNVVSDWNKWDHNRDRLCELTALLTLRNPMAAVCHVLQSSALIWRVTAVHGPFETYAVAFSPWPPIRYQVMTRLEQGHVFFDSREPRNPCPVWLAGTFDEYWYWLWWRTPFYLYVMLLAVAVAVVRSRSLRWALLLAPIGLHSFCLALVVPSQDFRYQFPVYLTSLLLSGFLLLCVPAPAAQSGRGQCSHC
jgi:hypothetical protein